MVAHTSFLIFFFFKGKWITGSETWWHAEVRRHAVLEPLVQCWLPMVPACPAKQGEDLMKLHCVHLNHAKLSWAKLMVLPNCIHLLWFFIVFFLKLCMFLEIHKCKRISVFNGKKQTRKHEGKKCNQSFQRSWFLKILTTQIAHRITRNQRQQQFISLGKVWILRYHPRTPKSWIVPKRTGWSKRPPSTGPLLCPAAIKHPCQRGLF